MKKLRQFIKDVRGSVFIIVGLTFISMVGVTAAAVDYARGSLLRSELISSIDAAGLAGGTVANSANLEAMVNKYYAVNLPAGYMSATIDPITHQLAADKATLTVNASAHLRNSMMQVVGWNMTNVAATTEITMERKGMELVLVLDNTGSMDSDGKMDALKTASVDLVNILYGNKETMENFWMGIVPFSQAVNIGNSRTTWVSGLTGKDWGTGNSWKGCVEARETSGRDVTDDPPATAAFPVYYSACVAWSSSAKWYNSWFGSTNSSFGGGSPSYTLRTGCNKSGSWGYTSPLDTIVTVSSTKYNWGPNQYCPQPLTAMTASKTTILGAINSMKPIGDTQINTGLIWGWRMLSPRWRTVWGGEMNTSSLPLNYNTPLMNKVIILLSDGDNSFVSGNYTAYGTLASGRIGTTNQSNAVTALNTKTSNLCTTLKAADKNILIYTVALGSSISNTGKTLLRNCASKPEYYFESADGDDLQTDFKTIGDSLSNLRISK